jgi:hypothetical protein
MHRYRTLVILVVIPLFARSAMAGLFDRSPRPDPNLRVPQLLGQVRGDREERKRLAAAEELRHYSPQTFPEIIPVLLDALQNDPAVAVRLQALHSLSSYRPISPAVGAALEQAQSRDPSLRVRMQARTTLVSYRWSGYHSGAKNEVPVPQGPVIMTGPKTSEPPLAVEPAHVTVPVVRPSNPPPLPLEPPLANSPPPLPAVPPTPPSPPQGPDLAPPPF